MGAKRVGKYIVYINRLIGSLIGELESLGNKLHAMGLSNRAKRWISYILLWFVVEFLSSHNAS